MYCPGPTRRHLRLQGIDSHDCTDETGPLCQLSDQTQFGVAGEECGVRRRLRRSESLRDAQEKSAKRCRAAGMVGTATGTRDGVASDRFLGIAESLPNSGCSRVANRSQPAGKPLQRLPQSRMRRRAITISRRPRSRCPDRRKLKAASSGIRISRLTRGGCAQRSNWLVRRR